MEKIFRPPQDENSKDGDEYPTYNTKNVQTKNIPSSTVAVATDNVFTREQGSQSNEQVKFDVEFQFDSDSTLVISSDEELEKSMLGFVDPDSTTTN